MKPGDKIRQSVPEDQAFPMVGIEAEIVEVKEDGIVVRFYHFYQKKVVEQFWPNRWKVELIEESS